RQHHRQENRSTHRNSRRRTGPIYQSAAHLISRTKIISSRLENISGFNEAAAAIKGFAFRSRPQNDSVYALTTAPGQRFVQQFLSQSSVALFRENIKISYVRVKLRFVNRIRYFLE